MGSIAIPDIQEIKKIKCFVVHYNRPTMLSLCLGALLLDKRLEVIVVDNGSDVHFDTLGCELIQMGKNCGHKVVWSEGISKRRCPNERYIVTDCDIVIQDAPMSLLSVDGKFVYPKDDYLEMLGGGLDKYPLANKIGLDLNTRDIPEGYKYRAAVIEHEKGYVMRRKIKKERDFVFSPIDTTFAMYREGYHTYSEWGTDHSGNEQTECRSMRLVGEKYECFHLGWAIIEPYNEEIRHYFDSIKDGGTGHWKEVAVEKDKLIDTEQ